MLHTGPTTVQRSVPRMVQLACVFFAISPSVALVPPPDLKAMSEGTQDLLTSVTPSEILT